MTAPAATDDHAAVPGASDILRGAAERLGLTALQVERALAEANITLASPVAADRRLRVVRVRVRGIKHSGDEFTLDQAYAPGVWAVVHPSNSAGKTSVLEFLVWPLRGDPRDLPPDVQSWVRQLSLDVVVAGRPTRIVLDLDPHNRSTIVRVFGADSVDQLVTADDGHSGLRLLARATGADEVTRCVGAFFLDALRMGQTKLWQSSGGADGEGAPQVHGWEAYFGACYLNPGGEGILLGDVEAVGLPARLLELFVDIPYSTALTQLSVAGKREKKTAAQGQRRAEGDAKAREGERAAWQHELAEVNSEIADLQAGGGGDLESFLRAADDASALLRRRQALLSDAGAEHSDVSAARVRAEQQLLDARETWQARRVLGRLDPVCCPRCEEPLPRERRREERARASCAVCTRPLPKVEAETAEAVLDEMEKHVAAAREAEQAAEARHDRALTLVDTALSAHRVAASAVEQAMAASQFHARVRELELRAAELRGRLAATDVVPADAPASVSTQILGAVEESVRAAVDASAKRLFPAMNTQIVELATRFGVQNLDSVRLDRGGKVNAVKAGVRTKFKKLSRGDRLRMRIATVIALLRVSAERGVTTHPGLLLIDSLAAEELTEAAARALISELQAITEELPDLMVVLTTAQPELVKGLPRDRLITSGGEHLF